MIEAPKTIERLEEISQIRNQQRKMEEEGGREDDDDEKLVIGDAISLSDVIQLETENNKDQDVSMDFLLDDIEVLA